MSIHQHKRFKKKKKIKLKYLVRILIFILIIFIIYSISNLLLFMNNDMVYIILDSENKIDNKFYKNIFIKINDYFNIPTNFLKMYVKEDNKTYLLNAVYKEEDNVEIYIYSSHQGEKYEMGYLENYNIVPDILMVDSMLKEKLDDINVTTVVEDADILSYMEENNMNHSESYIASRVFLTEAIKKYPSAKLYIDIHRDSATHDVTSVNIDGKSYAKLLFVIGLEYDNYESNLEVINNINNIILDKYPTLTRGIMKKSGSGVNGVYNQDLSSNVILIEIGGNENNIEEVNNTLDLLSTILKEYVDEKK